MLKEVLDALGIDQVDVIGNDSGGGIAQIFAAHNPERVRSLTLTNCDAHDNWPPEAFKPFLEMAAGGGLPDTLTALLADKSIFRSPGALGPGGGQAPAAGNAREEHLAGRARATAVLAAWRARGCRRAVRRDVPGRRSSPRTGGARPARGGTARAGAARGGVDLPDLGDGGRPHRVAVPYRCGSRRGGH